MVPEYQLGTAYGMMQSIQNLGLALVSLLAGALLTRVSIENEIERNIITTPDPRLRHT